MARLGNRCPLGLNQRGTDKDGTSRRGGWASESEIWMSNMGSWLPSRGRKADEGVAIPRCALMASSSLEELGNSAVITFSSGRRQARGVSGVPLLQSHGRGSFQLLVQAPSRCPVTE